MDINAFENKVVLVTGGSRGIGLETARELLKLKAKVVICARKQEGLDKAAAELNGGDNLLTVSAHLSKEADVSRLFQELTDKFGRLDVLINNMGMNLMTGSVVDLDYSLWQKIIDSNLNSTYLCSAAAARIMKKQSGGKIINISSIAGRKAAPGMGVYGVAKAAIEMLTKVMAAELASYNINVNALAPCMVRTDFSKPFWSDSAIYNEIVKGIPLGRIAEIEDVVRIILFLASGSADFITGETIMADGGACAI